MLNASLHDSTLTPTQLPPHWPTEYADDDHVLSSDVSLTGLSSRASTWSHTRSTSDGVQDLWPLGAFDDDEDLSTLQAARTAKQTNGAFTNRHIPEAYSLREMELAWANSRHETLPQPTASYRTTATVCYCVLAILLSNSAE